MPGTDPSRRLFLRNSLVVLSLPTILSARELAAAAQTAGAPFTTLGADEAAEFAAIAARIIPTDDTPGATEAGAIYFIDNVLGTSRTELVAPMREGLAGLQASARSSYDTPTFRALEPSQQDALLTRIESTPFFNTMRMLTIAGTFSLPEYGGNRDGIGWTLLGFEMQHMYHPPFGYYDAEYAREGR